MPWPGPASTVGGKLGFRLFGALAGLERDLIRDGSTAGMAQHGPGRRPSAVAHYGPRIAVARQLRDAGEHIMDAVAQIVGTSRTTLYRYLSKTPLTPAVS